MNRENIAFSGNVRCIFAYFELQDMLQKPNLSSFDIYSADPIYYEVMKEF